MGLLFLLLATGVIRTRQLEKSSQFLSRHLVLFFIPIITGVLLGTAASMAGATKAAQWRGLAGVMGILGMVLSALLMPILAPGILTFLQ
jgi:putative effector of murein hydrolase LrgA (UPF0299 family)